MALKLVNMLDNKPSNSEWYWPRYYRQMSKIADLCWRSMRRGMPSWTLVVAYVRFLSFNIVAVFWSATTVWIHPLSFLFHVSITRCQTPQCQPDPMSASPNVKTKAADIKWNGMCWSHKQHTSHMNTTWITYYRTFLIVSHLHIHIYIYICLCPVSIPSVLFSFYTQLCVYWFEFSNSEIQWSPLCHSARYRFIVVRQHSIEWSNKQQ